MIDDIDRLTTPEIRDIFKLVRLTASFPNLIYILAFDRERVEAALDETNVPGRAYLEKIIQVAFDLPAAPQQILVSEVLQELQAVLDGITGARFDDSRWSDVFAEIILPLIGNMRDVSRFVLSATSTLRALAEDIETVDLLAMESIRVFRPELFSQLRAMQTALTKSAAIFNGPEKVPEHQVQIDELLRIAGAEADLVKELLRRLFPAVIKYFDNNRYGSDWLASWRKAHRMASLEFLGMYFDRIAPTELRAFRTAEALVAAMSDPDLYRSTLELVPDGDLPDVLNSMENFRGDFPEQGIAMAVSELLNNVVRVPDGQAQLGGLLSLRPNIVVTRVVLRMLEQLKDGPRESAVREALPEITSFSSKLELLYSVGHRENKGSKLVPEGIVKELENGVFEELSAKPMNNFAVEWDLARVCSFVGERNGGLPALADEKRPDATRAVLSSVKGENRAQSIGSRHLRRTPVLAWDWLVELYGTEDHLRDAVASLRAEDGDTELVELAQKYLDGWRPERDNAWGDGNDD